MLHCIGSTSASFVQNLEVLYLFWCICCEFKYTVDQTMDWSGEICFFTTYVAFVCSISQEISTLFVALFLCSNHEFLINPCDQFTHVFHGHFTSTGVIIWLPQYQWSNSRGYRWNNYMKTWQSVNHALLMVYNGSFCSIDLQYIFLV